MSIVIPSSVFLPSSGNSGGLVWTVSMKDVNELGPIFCIMEGQSEVTSSLKLTA